jgi:hypothetical protein
MASGQGFQTWVLQVKDEKPSYQPEPLAPSAAPVSRLPPQPPSASNNVTNDFTFKIKTEKELIGFVDEIPLPGEMVVDAGVIEKVKVEIKTEETVPSKPAVKRPLFGNGGDGPSSKRPSQTRDPNDPWFAAYEAKRQEALNNMKQGVFLLI